MPQVEPLNTGLKPTTGTPLSDVPSVQSRLRALRLQRNEDEAAFAKKLSTRTVAVSTRDVQAWEAAERRPTPAQFERLSEMTGRSAFWMKTGREEA